MLYQVFIPAVSADGFNITLKLEAPNWLSALRSGLSKIGEQGDVIKNVVVEIQPDGTISISDPKTGRVFEIKELHEEAPAKDEEPAATDSDLPTVAMPAYQPDEPREQPAPRAGLEPEVEAPGTEPRLEPAPSAQQDAALEAPATEAQRGPEVKPQGFHAETSKAVQADPDSQILEEKKSEVVEDDPAQAPRRAHFVTEEVLADVFMDAQQLYDYDTDLQGAVEFALDLLMEKIPSEAGSIMFADINQNDLYFAAARGPKADLVMNFRVPMGKGIVGFSAKEGVSLTIGDARRDPRFYKRIGESIGFETRSVVCAPVEADGRCYGAIELINKKGSDSYTPGEMAVVTYVANRLADHINQVVMREA